MTDSRDIVKSLYLTHRPQAFDEVRGQSHVARTLANALRNGTVAHGYVFAGPRGTGKTSTARILAKALNCVGPDEAHRVSGPTPTPCGVCHSCREIAASNSLDVIEMDAASNRSIDDVRDLRDTVAFAPVRDRFKVYIIDEAHMLTREAFNALLKTLEEPPANVVFVLATTEPHKLPDTIVSRCQRFDFHRPSAQQIVELLTDIAAQEGIETDEEALQTIAEHAQGGFRDAIGALDRLRSFTDGRVRVEDVLEVLGVTDTQLLMEVTDIVADTDTAAALAFVHRLYERGTNYTQFIADLLRHLRRLFLLQNLMHAATDPTLLRALGQNVGLHAGSVKLLEPQAHRLSAPVLVHFMDLLGHAQAEIKSGLDARLQLELALVKITRPQLDLSPEALDERLRRLEEGHGPAAPAPAGGPPATAPSQQPPAAPREEAPKAEAAAADAAKAKADAAAAAAAKLKTESDAAAKAKAEAAAADAAKVKAEAAAAAAAKAESDAAAAKAEAARAADETAAKAKAADEAAAAKARANAEAEAAAAASTPAGPPVAAEEAPAAVAAAEAGDPLELVLRAWPQVLAQAEKVSGALHGMLRGARPVSVEGSRVTIGVPADYALKRLGEQGEGKPLAEALADVLGHAVQVHYQAGAPKRANDPAAPALTDAQRIALIQRELDAEIITDENG